MSGPGMNGNERVHYIPRASESEPHQWMLYSIKPRTLKGWIKSLKARENNLMAEYWCSDFMGIKYFVTKSWKLLHQNDIVSMTNLNLHQPYWIRISSTNPLNMIEKTFYSIK